MSKKQELDQTNKVSDSELEKLSGGSGLPLHIEIGKQQFLANNPDYLTSQPDYNSGGKSNKSGKGDKKKGKKDKHKK
ncbi:hypothetical protein Lqui_2399 [Legionella quinlivanii]|uniref:Uncharacterized protein n=1 Tax=Legionella quinlivanii TaxID=45073 RepID=A0A0W0XRV1_9GAMM|nr:hypothetical protein [Legionella quinlivanii]KTD47473.1 hypothetical protein Lqui_2399 [Legionella quinlivanii]MCW8451842.1 hypothetical protein [Legionella quinlivanii]SEG39418.1 hypothetical protein SAMN02746093_02785 [Legionella quinlivanii DSM 21216]STY09962.1 Uncharacterised protein [Legionella quinlivanii]